METWGEPSLGVLTCDNRRQADEAGGEDGNKAPRRAVGARDADGVPPLRSDKGRSNAMKPRSAQFSAHSTRPRNTRRSADIRCEMGVLA